MGVSVTSIEWTDRTWNPLRGCSIVSAGCTHCYAMKQAHRFSGPGKAYDGLTALSKGGPVWTGKVRTVPELLSAPLRWRKPRRIFVNSMSDLFHDDVPDDFIDQVFAVMMACGVLENRHHTFQVLTKRPNRMRSYLREEPRRLVERWAKAGDPLVAVDGDQLFSEFIMSLCSTTPTSEGGWLVWGYPKNVLPLRNVWLGVSVENQATADERIPVLLRTPAAVRFVSAEPLLGPVNFRKEWITLAAGLDHYPFELPPSQRTYIVDLLDWVIVGGESGPRARPCDVAWIRSTVEQCKAAGTPCFVKQLGARPLMRADSLEGRRAGDHPEMEWPEGTRFTTAPGDIGTERQGRHVALRDRKGGDMDEWPIDLRIREFPR